jgi:SAM-dependent methyltransferase
VYERGRPSYAPEAVELLIDELGLGPHRRLLDLAAGTGKLTRQLLPSGVEVVAVEPVAAMREAFAAAVPGVEILDGRAEAIPLPEESVDAVTVAQAFHWFEREAALAEIARVLRPGGGLALIWNERDESVPWVAQLSKLMHWDIRMPYDVGIDWRDVVDESRRFTPLQKKALKHEQELDADRLVDRVVSTSYIAAMDDAERQTILDGVRALISDFPPRFHLPYVSHVYWCRRR